MHYDNKIMRALARQTPIAPLEDEQEIARAYSYWRSRTLYSITIGYGVFYFVRKNISFATKSICDEFQFTNVQWGMLLSLASIAYAFSKFASGIVADHANPRYLMAIGLFGSAVMNCVFGFTSSLAFFTGLWVANSIFQGFGMTPCSHLLTSWYGKREIGRAWGIWNSSHQMGGALISVFSAFLVANYGWRSAFFIPALIALVGSLWLVNRLRDTPESLGLPPIEVYQRPGEPRPLVEAKEKFRVVFKKYILKNPWIWVVSIANIFVYIVRVGILDWMPKFLEEVRGFSLQDAGFALTGFEIAGIFGAYFAGWLSDTVFAGRRGPVSAIFMMLVTVGMIALTYVPSGQIGVMSSLLIVLGFLVNGPLMLVAVAAADFATKKAAATAVGLTGLFGYFGATLCGITTGYLVDNYGWDSALWFYVAAAIIGTLVLASTWRKAAFE